MAASFKIMKSSESDTEDETPAINNKKATCNICVQQEARYTCPRCNIAYCCLDCYRHKKHEGCSESFYRDCVLDEMKEYGVRPEDRQKVLEMLAREQQQQQQAEDSDDDDTPDLSERLEGLDLDRDAGEVWRRLTPQEREEFAHMLKDGRLARLVTVWTPWWTAAKRSMVQESEDGEQLPEGFPPHLTDLPDIHQLIKGKPSADVKHNVVNVLSAYAFITRLHNGDHQQHPLECAEELLKVCDVLNHSVNFPSPREAAYSVIHLVHKPESGFVVPPSFPTVLLGDVVRILQGPRMSPLCAALSALSDLSRLLKDAHKELKKSSGQRKEGGGRGSSSSSSSSSRSSPGQSRVDREGAGEESGVERRLFLAKKKVTFLLSWTQRFGMCLPSLCHELDLELECLKSEAKDTASLQSAVEQGLQSGHLQPKASSLPESSSPAPHIQELS